jgi:hypothetical protein
MASTTQDLVSPFINLSNKAFPLEPPQDSLVSALNETATNVQRQTERMHELLNEPNVIPNHSIFFVFIFDCSDASQNPRRAAKHP